MLKLDDRLIELPSLRRARKRWLLMGIGVGIGVAVLIAVVAAVLWAPRISWENERMLANESEYLAREAYDLLAKGDRYQATQVALSALPDRGAFITSQNGQAHERPFVPAAQMVLEDALGVYPSDTMWSPNYSSYGLRSKGCAYSDDGLVAALDHDDSVVVFDALSGEEKARIVVPDVEPTQLIGETYYRLQLCNEYVTCLGEDGVACYSIATQKLQWKVSIEHASALDGCAASAYKSLLAVVTSPQFDGEKYASPILYVIDVATGDVRSIELEGYENRAAGAGSRVAFNDEDTLVAASVEGNLFVANLAEGTSQRVELAQPYSDDVCFGEGSEAKTVFAISSNSTVEQLPVCVQAFNMGLSERWSYEEHMQYAFNKEGVLLSAPIRLRGVATFDGEVPRMYAMLGGALVGLDVRSGHLGYRLVRDEPVVDCIVKRPERKKFNARPMLMVVTSGGEVLLRRPSQDESLETDQSPSLVDADVGETLEAKLLYEDDALCLLLWSQSPDKCRAYAYGGRGVLLEDAEITGTYDADASFRWIENNRVAITNSHVVLLDEATLEPSKRIPLDALEGIDASRGFDVCFANDDEVFYAYGDEADGKNNVTYNTKVFAIDKRDGAVVRDFTIKEMEPSYTSYTGLVAHRGSSGETLLVAHDVRDVCVIDPADGSELFRASEKGALKQAYLFGTTLVAYAGTGLFGGEGFSTYNIAAQKPIHMDVTAYTVWDQDLCCIAADEENMRLVVACSDGIVRMFNMRDGTVAWQSSPITTGVGSVYFVSESKLLLQDERGCLLLLSAEDGSILRASSVAVPRMDSFGTIGEGGLGVGHYEKPGLAISIGLVLVSLDVDEFGPMSLIRSGGFLNADASRVAIWDTVREQMVVTHRPTLEQLYEMADLMAKSRPLSNTERWTYRVAGDE